MSPQKDKLNRDQNEPHGSGVGTVEGDFSALSPHAVEGLYATHWRSANETDTNMPSTARDLDKFYTQPAVAQRLYEDLADVIGDDQVEQHRWLEPAAGAGAFFKLLPEGRVGLDLAPECEGVETGDFLTWTPPVSQDNRPLAVLTNPPFGKNSSLAVAFINRAVDIGAKWVAMILPRTFEKSSMQDRISPYLHLAHKKELDLCSFTFEGEPRAVPCVFQVWERRDSLRAKVSQKAASSDFEFVKRDRADFAFQRVGAYAGTVKDLAAPNTGAGSHMWVRSADRTPAGIARVRARLAAVNWDVVKHCTAGNPSISQTDVVARYDATPVPAAHVSAIASRLSQIKRAVGCTRVVDVQAASAASNPSIVVACPAFKEARATFNAVAKVPTTQAIAIVVPGIWERTTYQARLSHDFHLVSSERLDGFKHNGKQAVAYLQVWKRGTPPRARLLAKKSTMDFEFVKDVQDADIVIRRVGNAAGKVLPVTKQGMAWASHMFIKVSKDADVAAVQAVFKAINWTPIKAKCGAVPSINRGDVVACYEATKVATAVSVYERIKVLEENSMEYKERAKTGTVYTPAPIARSMIRLARIKLTDTVWEPCVGRGVFLFAMVEHLVDERGMTYEKAARWVESHVHAQDSDEQAVKDLRTLWRDYFAARGVVSNLGKNLRVADTLFDPIDHHFDLAIGNPPYLGGPSMPKELRGRLKAAFSTIEKGNGDMYFAFVQVALEKAERTCLLVPRTWMEAIGAATLRNLLRPKLRAVVDCGANQRFKNVVTNVSVMITGTDTQAPLLHRFGFPEESNTPWAVWFRQDRSLTDKFNFQRNRIERLMDDEVLDDLVNVEIDTLTGNNWCFRVEAPIFDGRVSFKPSPIKAKGKPKVTDKVFLGTTFTAPAENAPRYLKMTRVKTREQALTEHHRLLCPYDANFQAVQAENMDAGLMAWFDAVRPDLDGRKMPKKAQFFEYKSKQALRDYPLDEKLVLIPYILPQGEAFDPVVVTTREVGGRFLLGSGYMLRLKDPANLDRVMGILRSPLMAAWLKQEGALRKGDYRSFSARILREMPTGAKRAADGDDSTSSLVGGLRRKRKSRLLQPALLVMPTTVPLHDR